MPRSPRAFAKAGASASAGGQEGSRPRPLGSRLRWSRNQSLAGLGGARVAGPPRASLGHPGPAFCPVAVRRRFHHAAGTKAIRRGQVSIGVNTSGLQAVPKQLHTSLGGRPHIHVDVLIPVPNESVHLDPAGRSMKSMRPTKQDVVLCALSHTIPVHPTAGHRTMDARIVAASERRKQPLSRNADLLDVRPGPTVKPGRYRQNPPPRTEK